MLLCFITKLPAMSASLATLNRLKRGFENWTKDSGVRRSREDLRARFGIRLQ